MELINISKKTSSFLSGLISKKKPLQYASSAEIVETDEEEVASAMIVKQKFSLKDCRTSEEVIDVLAKIADTASLSMGYALKAQLYVIKYISSSEMIGSTLDLLFKNIQKSLEYAEGDEVELIRERTGLLLNNFIFFMTAKLEWEFTDNRKKLEENLINTSNDLAGNILEMVGYSTKMDLDKADTTKLGKVLFDPKKENDGWYRTFKKHFFKNARLKEKEAQFLKSIDLLAKKLETRRSLIGPNNLISGIFENYREALIKSHSEEWLIYEKKAKSCQKKSWSMAILTIVVGLLCGSLISIILLKYGLPNMIHLDHFSKMGGDWMGSLWICLGIATGVAALIVGISYRVGGLRYMKKGRMLREERAKYYDNIIELFREPSPLLLQDNNSIDGVTMSNRM